MPGTGIMSKKIRNPIVKRAIGWRKVASEQEDPFLKFSIEYIAFNALCRAKYGYEKRDRDIIETLKKEIPPSQISKNKICELKQIAPIKNVRNTHLGNRRNVIRTEDLMTLAILLKPFTGYGTIYSMGIKGIPSKETRNLWKLVTKSFLISMTG